MFKLVGVDNKVEVINESTFKELNMQEVQMEEIIRKNLEVLYEEDETLIVVGQQVRNSANGISDLTAIDKNGTIVLIEIKRDRGDIVSRKEPFEFQAIRYAAAYANIKTIEELVEKVYESYVSKYENDLIIEGMTPYQYALDKLQNFLKDNNSLDDFNRSQRIILVASDYDEQTLSAVAWLNSNNINISCFKMVPYLIDKERFFQFNKILPLQSYTDFYVDIHKSFPSTNKGKSGVRKVLPKIDKMLEWGIVKPNDIIKAKGRDDEAVLQPNGRVIPIGEDQEVSILFWLKNVFGWSNVDTYNFSKLKGSKQTLAQLREEYLEEQTAVTEDIQNN